MDEKTIKTLDRNGFMLRITTQPRPPCTMQRTVRGVACGVIQPGPKQMFQAPARFAPLVYSCIP